MEECGVSTATSNNDAVGLQIKLEWKTGISSDNDCLLYNVVAFVIIILVNKFLICFMVEI